MKNMQTHWERNLKANIIDSLGKARKAGTTSLSAANLWQITTIPQHGGPQGTNAILTARQSFNATLDTLSISWSAMVEGRLS